MTGYALTVLALSAAAGAVAGGVRDPSNRRHAAEQGVFALLYLVVSLFG